MRGIALFALLALATACGKDEAAPEKNDAGMKTPAMTKPAGDIKKVVEETVKETDMSDGTGSDAMMRTVTLDISGMT